MLEKIFNALRDEWRDELIELDRFEHMLGIEIIDSFFKKSGCILTKYENIYEFEFRFYETGSFNEEKYQLVIEGKRGIRIDSGYVACSTPDLIDYFIRFSQKAVGFILGEIKEMEKEDN